MENQNQMNIVPQWQKLQDCSGLSVKRISKVGKKKVYDISVADVEHYILENGVVTHNTGIYYSANTIFIIGRQQEKDGQEVTGYNFVINVEKSRFSREKSKIPITVMHDAGISRWSGLLDMALESGHVIKPSNGWYSRVDMDTGEVEDKKFREKDTNSSDFWLRVLQQPTFRGWVKSKYQVGNTSILSDEALDTELDEMLEE